MRIITGSAKGRKIKIPKKKIRPAKDFVRQAVFSMLYGLVENSKAADLFAGSGAYGLEALSRGARSVTFVDADKRCVAAIETNLNTMSFGGKGVVVKQSVKRFVENYIASQQVQNSGKFNLIFLDPPYSSGAQVHLLKALAKILAPQGIIIFEHAKETKVPEEIGGLTLFRQRTYGITTVSLLTPKLS